MARKNQTHNWGEGGNLVSLKDKKLFSCFIIFFLIFAFSFQPVSFARHSGDGKMAKFNTGKFLINTGIAVGSMVVLTPVSGGLNSALTPGGGSFATGFSNALRGLGKYPLSHIVSGYSAFVVASQVSNAVANAGAYYEWSPATTRLVSSVAVYSTGGLINPSGVLGDSIGAANSSAFSTMLKGAFAGGIQGLARGAAMAVVDGNRQRSSIKGEIAGLVAGIYGGFLGRTMVDPNTYNSVWVKMGNDSAPAGAGKQKPSFSEQAQAWGDNEIQHYKDMYNPLLTDDMGNPIDGGGGSSNTSGISSHSSGQLPSQERPGSYGTAGLEMQPSEKSKFSSFPNEFSPNEFSPNDPKSYSRPPEPFHPSSDFPCTELSGIPSSSPGFSSGAEIPLPDGNINSPAPNVSAPDVRSVVELSPGTSPYAEWAEKLGGLSSLKKQIGPHVTLQEAQRLLKSPHTYLVDTYTGPNGIKTNYYVAGGTQFYLPQEQAQFLLNLRWDSAGSMRGTPPGIKPSSSQVMKRIVLMPFTETANIWPILASRSLAIAATHNMNRQWQPLVGGVISSTVSPFLEVTANAFNLKPSLWSNIDRDLGYYPQLKEDKARRDTNTAGSIFNGKVADMKDLTPENLGDKLKQTFPNLSSKEIEAIKAGAIDISNQYNTEQNIAENGGKELVPFKECVANAGGNVIKKRLLNGTPDGTPNTASLFKAVGISRGDIVSYSLSNTMNNVVGYELPTALISGGIEAGFSSLMKGDGSTEDMLISLSGTIATGIVRGAVWHLYSKRENEKAARKFKNGEKLGPDRWPVFVKNPNPSNRKEEQKYVLRDNPNWRLEKPEDMSEELPEDFFDVRPQVCESNLIPTSLDDPNGHPIQQNNTLPIKHHVFIEKEDGEILTVRPEDLTRSSAGQYKLVGGYWVPKKGDYYYHDERVVRMQAFPDVVPLGDSIFHSVQQASVEFGDKTLSMGLPYAPQGRMTVYSWDSYMQNLRGLSSIMTATPYTALARSAGQDVPNPADIFAIQGAEKGKGIIGRNVLTTLPDTPLGKIFDMAPILPVSGYKGMPFSAGVKTRTGINTVHVNFYPYWPYHQINPLPRDPYYLENVKRKLYGAVTSENLGPNGKGKPSVPTTTIRGENHVIKVPNLPVPNPTGQNPAGPNSLKNSPNIP